MRTFDDLHTPSIVSYISIKVDEIGFELQRNPNTLPKKAYYLVWYFTQMLGFLQKDSDEWSKGGASADEEAEFDAIAMRREQARAQKDWAAADAARDEAAAKGIVLEDGPEGTTWRKA